MLAVKKSKALPRKTLEVVKLGDGNQQNKSVKELTSCEFNKVNMSGNLVCNFVC